MPPTLAAADTPSGDLGSTFQALFELFLLFSLHNYPTRWVLSFDR